MKLKNLQKLESQKSSEHCCDAKISAGSRVSIVDLNTREILEFRLVSPARSGLQPDAVSVWAPLGKALLGRSVGETIYVKAPGGDLRYRILKIWDREWLFF